MRAISFDRHTKMLTSVNQRLPVRTSHPLLQSQHTQVVVHIGIPGTNGPRSLQVFHRLVHPAQFEFRHREVVLEVGIPGMPAFGCQEV